MRTVTDRARSAGRSSRSPHEAKRKSARKDAEDTDEGPRALATATITFGLVTVPVRLYPTASVSGGLSFHMLHAKDRSRLKQQYVCAQARARSCPRSEMVKGFEVAKGRYVVLTDEELRALDAQASRGIEIAEFVPEDSLSPVYIERPLLPRAGRGRREGLRAAGGRDGGTRSCSPSRATPPAARTTWWRCGRGRGGSSCTSSSTATRCAPRRRSRPRARTRDPRRSSWPAPDREHRQGPLRSFALRGRGAQARRAS